MLKLIKAIFHRESLPKPIFHDQDSFRMGRIHDEIKERIKRQVKAEREAIERELQELR